MAFMYQHHTYRNICVIRHSLTIVWFEMTATQKVLIQDPFFRSRIIQVPLWISFISVSDCSTSCSFVHCYRPFLFCVCESEIKVNHSIAIAYFVAFNYCIVSTWLMCFCQYNYRTYLCIMSIYNENFFHWRKQASKIEMRIIHGILCSYSLVSIISMQANTWNLSWHGHWLLTEK